MTVNPAEQASSSVLASAREALAHGYQPVPIRRGSKAPRGMEWQHRRFTEDEEFEKEFSEVESLGLMTGEASKGLVDVDLDHPIAWKLRDTFLPTTAMRTGRVGNPSSHYWYRVTDDIPGYRKYTLPGGETTVELRSSGGHQTLIPPSVWYPKKGDPGSPQAYRWEGEPWGGTEGPSEISGKHLAVRVASLGLTALLIENWPKEGQRHDAYLALAGGMLRLGSEGVHPYWDTVLPQLIEAIAEATHDGDGARTRVEEVMATTRAKLDARDKAQGWTTLAGIISSATVDKARVIVGEIERIVDWERHFPLHSTNAPLIHDRPDDHGGEATLFDDDEYDENSPVKPVNPLDARVNTWEPVNMEPYLAKEVVVPSPTILRRSDGQGLFYPGRVNSLYGKSESAKSWVATYICLQEISIGQRVMYIDLEDDPAMAIERLTAMGAGIDDIRYQFTYIRPEGPHLKMQRDTWGNEKPTEIGRMNADRFKLAMDQVDPGLVVVDGMSVLYGLHNLNTNDVASTDVITNWLKSVTRNGRTTVIIIDHTSKGAEKGSGPIGSQHKISMVQGTAIQVVPIAQPKPGSKGHMELVVGKDRPGRVRQASNDDKNAVCADVYLDSRVEGITKVTIDPPVKHDVVIDAKSTFMAEMHEVMTNHPGVWLTMAQIMEAVPPEWQSASPRAKSDARDKLISTGVIERRGSTKNSEYRLAE